MKLVRTGPKELTFVGDSFVVNGVNLKEKLDDALARIKKLEAGGGGGSNGGSSSSNKVFEVYVARVIFVHMRILAVAIAALTLVTPAHSLSRMIGIGS